MPIPPERLLSPTVEFYENFFSLPKTLVLDVPLSRFHDEPTSPRILSAAFYQRYGSSCIESLDDIQEYHLP